MKRFMKCFFYLAAALCFSVTSVRGADILYIYSTDAVKQPGEDAIKSFMESLGHTVTYFDDNESEAATEAAAAASDLVFISEGVSSGQIANEITEIEVPDNF